MFLLNVKVAVRVTGVSVSLGWIVPSAGFSAPLSTTVTAASELSQLIVDQPQVSSLTGSVRVFVTAVLISFSPLMVLKVRVSAAAVMAVVTFVRSHGMEIRQLSVVTLTLLAVLRVNVTPLTRASPVPMVLLEGSS